MKLIRLPSGPADILKDPRNSLPHGAAGGRIGCEMSGVDRRMYSPYATVVDSYRNRIKTPWFANESHVPTELPRGSLTHQGTIRCRTFPPVQHKSASCRLDDGDGLTSF